jgi:hypothetical protein
MSNTYIYCILVILEFFTYIAEIADLIFKNTISAKDARIHTISDCRLEPCSWVLPQKPPGYSQNGRNFTTMCKFYTYDNEGSNKHRINHDKKRRS